VKSIFLGLLYLVPLYGTELIHISNSTNEENLKTLRDKYKTDIIINDNNAYIIPQECKLVRYFGGLSQNEIKTPKSDKHTAPVTMTQEVFEAKNSHDIEVEVQKQKSIDEVEGKVAKEFLEDTTGHLFGGISQTPLDLTKQTKIVNNKKQYTHLTCKLLDDGSGYKLYGIKDAKLYSADGFKLLTDTFIPFN
jgi:hypothetical protein